MLLPPCPFPCPRNQPDIHSPKLHLSLQTSDFWKLLSWRPGQAREGQGIHTSTHTLHLQSISGGIWWTQTHFLCSSDKITLNYMFCNTSQSSPTAQWQLAWLLSFISCLLFHLSVPMSLPLFLLALKSLPQDLMLGEPTWDTDIRIWSFRNVYACC